MVATAAAAAGVSTSWGSWGHGGGGRGLALRAGRIRDRVGPSGTEFLGPLLNSPLPSVLESPRGRRVLGTRALRQPLELPPIPRSFPPLPEPALPPFQKVVLGNGLRVFILEDHELGLVGGQLCVKGGAKLEPPNKVGLASLLASVQRSGGTVDHPEEALDDILEDLAASIETGSSASEMDVGFECLPVDVETVFKLFAQVVLSPALPRSKLELTRFQALGALARRNDRPEAVASRKMRELLYGKDSPYGRSPSPGGIGSITTEDLRDFHRLSFCDPSMAVLGIWGDIDSEKILKTVDQQLGATAWGLSLSMAARSLDSVLDMPSLVALGNPKNPPLHLGQRDAPGGLAFHQSVHMRSFQTRQAGPNLPVGDWEAGVVPAHGRLWSSGREGFSSSSSSREWSRGTDFTKMMTGRGSHEFAPEGEQALQGSDLALPAAAGAEASVAADQPSASTRWEALCPLVARAASEGVGEEDGAAAAPLGFYGADIPGLTQGYVRLGELGTSFKDDDVFSLDVLNSIFNGFGGRLFDKIRSQKGLAYSVSGSWSPSIEHRGTFVAGGETQLDNVFKFVTALTDVLMEATAAPPTIEELQRAKDSALNSFVFNFTSTGAQMERILTYELYGIDQHFPFLYRQRVMDATSDGVLQAAKRRLHPQQQRLLIVSDFSRLEPALASFGLRVNMLDLDN